MLGATQKQMFTMNGDTPSTPATYDSQGNELTPYIPGTTGGTEVTGFQPYKPYSTDMEDYVAGFSPLQQQAQSGAANLQVPGQYGQASQMTGIAGAGSLASASQAGGLSNQALGYGQAGSMYGGLGAQQAISAAQQAQNQAAGYGGMGAGYGAQAAGLAPQAQQYGQTAADIGMGGLGYGAMGAGYGQQAAQAAQQGYGAGANYAQQATNPAATAAYMSPYMQNVVDYQKTQAARDYQIAQQARQAGAVSRGAFGGSRQAIENAEAQRNLMSQLQGIEGMGAQEAFKNAQQAQQYGANLGLQGLQAGYQGTGMGIQGAQTGLSGLGTAMQGQQAGLSGLQGASSLYGQGMQGAGVGLSGVGQQLAGGQLGLAGTAQGIQGAQVGQAGVSGAVNAGQYGLQGLGQYGQMAGQLGQLGTAQLAAQQGIIGTQGAQGLTQQQQEQSKINQAIQDYATQQQYPMMQLGFMSNMLRGLPMQAQSTQMYQAQPSTLQQGIGLLGAGASLYGAQKAGGGQIKEMAEGGIAGYKYGGAIPEAKLTGMADNLSIQQLQQRLADKELDRGERQVFEDALSAKTKDKARYAGIAGAGGGLFNTMGYAGGGILAFADEGEVKDPQKLADEINLIGSQLDAVTKEAGGKNAPGSKQRAFAPEKVVEFENLQKRKGELQTEYADLMSKAGLDKPAIGYRSNLAPTTLYPNATEQAVLGQKPPAAAGAQPTTGELQAFDEATKRYLAEQKAGKGAAGATGSKGSEPSGAPGGVGTGPTSSLGGILAGLRKEGPQGEFGADYLDRLKALEASADQRMSRADKIAMAKGFLKFGSTAAPGGIGQAAVAGLGEYTDQYGKAIESDEKFKMENAKLQQDILALRRAEERGDVKLASEMQDKIADRANRLQSAQISASASHSAGAREDAYVKQLMAQGMSLEQALQAVKGAGRAEANDIARQAKADAVLAGNLAYMKYSASNKPEDIAKAEAIKQHVYTQYGIGTSRQASVGGGSKGAVDASNPLLGG
jgi:hypothetical protein